MHGLVQRVVALLAALSLLQVGLCDAQAYRPGGAPGARSGLVYPAVSLPFTLSMLPSDAVIDFDPSVLSGSTVSSWPARIGSATFTQATAAQQPTLIANGWANKPVVRFTGTSTTNPTNLVSDEPLVATAYNFLVAYRGPSQNGVATSKIMFETARPADSLVAGIFLLRSTNNPAQDTAYFGGLGGLSSGSSIGSTGFTAGAGAILVSELWTTKHGGLINGASAPGFASIQTNTATRIVTRLGATTTLGDSGSSFSLAKRVRVDIAKLPGGETQQYNRAVVEGYLAWLYGVAGDPLLDLVAALPTDHPFKARAPLATDWFAFPITPQFWGNSLGNGAFNNAGVVFQTSKYRLSAQNGTIGGTTSTQILARMQANQDAQNGTSSGLSVARVREKVAIFSDLVENDGTATPSISVATGRSNVAQMIALAEAGQGAAPGQGRIIFWGRWRGNGLPGTDASLPSKDAEMAQDIAEYPKYIAFDPVSGRRGMGQILAYEARPDGLMPDADAWARGVISAGYRSSDGTGTHLNDLGYARADAIILAQEQTNGWYPK